jgi:hypothetical protein
MWVFRGFSQKNEKNNRATMVSVKLISVALGAYCACRFFSLHPAGSGRKTFDKPALRAVRKVKNRLIGDFWRFYARSATNRWGVAGLMKSEPEGAFSSPEFPIEGLHILIKNPIIER